MRPIKAKKNINLNGTFYEKGEEIKVETKEQLIFLQAKGWIEPLTIKEIQDFGTVKEIPRFIKEGE